MDETEMNLEDGNSDISEENKWQQSLLTCRGVWPYLQTPREKMGMGHRAHQRNPPRSFSSVQFISVAQSCPTLCNPMDCSTPGLPVHHQLPEFTQTHVHESVLPSSHLSLCRPFLLLPPIPPSIRVFSNESTLHIGSWSQLEIGYGMEIGKHYTLGFSFLLK